jgi:hypothetical protein
LRSRPTHQRRIERAIRGTKIVVVRRSDQRIPGETRWVRKLGGDDQVVPVLTVEAAAPTLERIDELDDIVAVGLTQTKERPASTAWHALDEIPYMITPPASHNGTGVVVADVYGGNGMADTTYSGFASGVCTPPSGPNYKCYCPGAAASGAGGNHIAQAMGFVKNSHPSLPGGTANDATIIVANDVDGDYCTSASVAGGVDWALDNNADVINRSASNSTANARYLDYRARISPFPLVVASAGNTTGSTVSSDLLNGVVVGAADDLGDSDRDNLKTISVWSGTQSSQWINPGGLGASGRELPHLLAPGTAVSTLDGQGGTSTPNGTSFSAPQVSGIGAALIEASGGALNGRPEALFAILLAAPEQNVDGLWPLNFVDSVDDKDGVGAVNARFSQRMLSKVDGGWPAVSRAHDYGTITSSGTPAGSTYSEVWSAVVAPGQWLRVAAILFAKGTCTIGSASSCGARDYPRFRLRGSLGATPKAESGNLNQNYQYFGWKNTGLAGATISLTITVDNWDGITSTPFAIAWTTDAYT